MNHLLFESLDVSKEVKRAIADMGFEEATPIQTLSIPLILEGRDILGQAQTGTGKTCAFGIPAVEKADVESSDVQTLILCPTRELAIQIAEELKLVAKHKRGVRILPIYGGQSIDRQLVALKGNPQIIIGTPGRVMDHLRRRTLKIENLKLLVLDEADEMLNMGFKEDIDTILETVPNERQTVLFSATMPRPILEITKRYQKNVEHIQIAHKQLEMPLISQFVIETRESMKIDILSRILDAENIKLSMVFCNTKRRVDEVTLHLQARGYMAAALHGDMNQQQRDRVMAQFRKSTLDVLVATDVAARGIDVDDIEAVFNIDVPNDEEYYVHRIGRTGRAGKSGSAYTFLTPGDIRKMKDIQHFTKAKLSVYKVPTILDLEQAKSASLLEDAIAETTKGIPEKYIRMIEKFLEEQTSSNTEDDTEEQYVTSLDLAAAFLKIAVEKSTTVKNVALPPIETYEEPKRTRSFNDGPPRDRDRAPYNNGPRNYGGRGGPNSNSGKPGNYGKRKDAPHAKPSYGGRKPAAKRPDFDE